MSSIRLQFVFAALLLMFLPPLHAAPVRLAILSGPESRAVADLLTVELSRAGVVELVERDDIERIVKEIGAAALHDDPGSSLRAGELLHADGILFLKTQQTRGVPCRLVRLSAVAAGAVVHVSTEPIPLESSDTAWARDFAFRLGTMIPKLTLGRKELIPLSLLNFRADLGGEANRELERLVTRKGEEQLIAQPRVVLLERTRLDDLEFERICKWDREKAHFWTCGGLVDGRLSAGTGTNHVRITALYSPPGGAPPGEVKIAARLDALDVAARACAEGLVLEHARTQHNDCWSPAAEGQRFLKEAESAFTAKLYREAATAVEVARILGLDSPEMRRLRTMANLRSAVTEEYLRFVPVIRSKTDLTKNDYGIELLAPERMVRAIESFMEEMDSVQWDVQYVFNRDVEAPTYHPLLIDLTREAGNMLYRLNMPGRPSSMEEAERALSDRCAELMDRAMAAVEQADPSIKVSARIRDFPFVPVPLNSNENRYWANYGSWQILAVRFAPLWTKSEGETAEYYRRVLREGYYGEGWFGSALVDLFERLGAEVGRIPPESLFASSMQSCPEPKRNGNGYSFTYPLFIHKSAGTEHLPAGLARHLDPLTRSMNRAAERAWQEEIRADTSFFAKAAVTFAQAAQVEHSNGGNEEKLAARRTVENTKADWLRVSEAYFQKAGGALKGETHIAVPKPRLPETFVEVEATPFWDPPLELLDPRPNPLRTRTMDVRPIPDGHWFFVTEVEEKVMPPSMDRLESPQSNSGQLWTPNSQRWWLVRQTRNAGPPLVLPLSGDFQNLVQPEACWAADDAHAVAAVGETVVMYRLDTLHRTEVRTHVRCLWPVLAPPWTYFSFSGDGSGVLRVHLDTGELQVLTSTRRKPALTPYDDQPERMVGPGLRLSADEVGYCGNWTPLGKTETAFLRIHTRTLAMDLVGRHDPGRPDSFAIPDGCLDEATLIPKDLSGSAMDGGKPDPAPTALNRSMRNVLRLAQPRLLGKHFSGTTPHITDVTCIHRGGWLPGEMFYVCTWRHEPRGVQIQESERDILHLAPGATSAVRVRPRYRDDSPPGTSWARPERVAADEQFVYLFGGSKHGNWYGDGRVWKIDREHLRVPVMDMEGFGRAHAAELLKSPLGKVGGLTLEEGIRELRAAGYISSPSAETTHEGGGRVSHHFSMDGIRLEVTEGRITLAEGQAAGHDRKNKPFRGPVPLGIRWEDTAYVGCRNLGKVESFIDSGEKLQRWVYVYRFDRIRFTLIFNKVKGDFTFPTRGIRCFRIEFRPA